MKHLPGPLPTSCMTCRRRKKKCDRKQPSCGRCSEGGYKCLGYEGSSSPRSAGPSTSCFAHLDSGQTSGTTWVLPQTGQITTTQSDASITIFPDFLSPSASSSQQPLHLPQPILSKQHSLQHPAIIEKGSSTCLISQRRHDHAPLDKGDSPDPILESQGLAASHQTQSLLTASGFNIDYALPPTFIPNAQASGTTIRFIMSEYESVFELMFCRPLPTLMKIVRGRFASRLMASSIAHWSSYVGAEMFRALKLQGELANVDRFVPWLDRLDTLCLTPANDATLDDLVGRLSGALELIFLKNLTSRVKSGYTLLRRMAPVFMQVAFADPTLWPHDLSSNGISLANALTASRYEIGRFIFMDTITSLVYGIPPLVEYDTSHPMIPTGGDPRVELAHGCPARFIFSIVKINQWRAEHRSCYLGQDSSWKEIEADTHAWRPQCDYDPDYDSGTLVTKVAIQEAWRHALLIYLYMGMCDVTSHDSRVQSSVQQISRLHTLMESQSATGMHLITPLLLAAVCTRSECDRSRFRATLSQMGQRKTWLPKGVDFGLVLDHLWDGAAANGGSVTWNDYVNSRKAMIDVGV